MSGAIAIFVKTPGHSAVKTRLAEARGVAFAEAFHRAAAKAVAAVVRSALGVNAPGAYWAIAEDSAIAAQAWPAFTPIAQGEGGLGARMARVHGALVDRHGAAILIGADAPQLDATSLLRTLDWLQRPAPRQAIGRARDGGFWLYGSNRSVPLAVWENVAYSAADTADIFVHALDGRGEWLELPILTDVDRAGDLVALRAELALLHKPLSEQSALARWLDARGVAEPVP